MHATIPGRCNHLRPPRTAPDPGCCCCSGGTAVPAAEGATAAAAPLCFSCILALAPSSAVAIVCMSHSMVFSQFSKSPTSCATKDLRSLGHVPPARRGILTASPQAHLEGLVELINHPHPFCRLLVELDGLELQGVFGKQPCENEDLTERGCLGPQGARICAPAVREPLLR